MEGNHVTILVDANPGIHLIASREGDLRTSMYGHYASLSPDGSQLAYATCQYETERHRKAWFDMEGREAFNYEIAVIAVDGMSQKRLTESLLFAHFPVWSPDGGRIAFSTNTGQQVSKDFPRGLFTMDPDGSNVSEVFGPHPGNPLQVDLYPLVWSPEGGQLAFIGLAPFEYPIQQALYIVSQDGLGLTRIGQDAIPRPLLRERSNAPVFPVVSPLAWSPDGTALSFATFAGGLEEVTGNDTRDGGVVAVHIVGPDGSNLHSVWRSEPNSSRLPITHIEWSPDGSELLLVSDTIEVIRADGTGIRRLYGQSDSEVLLATWSRDGSRIAVYAIAGNRSVDHLEGVVARILTVDRDGTNVRLVASVEAD